MANNTKELTDKQIKALRKKRFTYTKQIKFLGEQLDKINMKLVSTEK